MLTSCVNTQENVSKNINSLIACDIEKNNSYLYSYLNLKTFIPSGSPISFLHTPKYTLSNILVKHNGIFSIMDSGIYMINYNILVDDIYMNSFVRFALYLDDKKVDGSDLYISSSINSSSNSILLKINSNQDLCLKALDNVSIHPPINGVRIGSISIVKISN